MPRNDGVETRRQRIQIVNHKVVGLLNISKDKWIPLKKTVADLQYETGLTLKRIMEYLSIGETRGLFVIDVKNDQIRKVNDA